MADLRGITETLIDFVKPGIIKRIVIDHDVTEREVYPIEVDAIILVNMERELTEKLLTMELQVYHAGKPYKLLVQSVQFTSEPMDGFEQKSIGVSLIGRPL